MAVIKFWQNVLQVRSPKKFYAQSEGINITNASKNYFFQSASTNQPLCFNSSIPLSLLRNHRPWVYFLIHIVTVYPRCQRKLVYVSGILSRCIISTSCKKIRNFGALSQESLTVKPLLILWLNQTLHSLQVFY